MIINFGDYWNEDIISRNKEKIIETTANIAQQFKRAYRFFAAAKNIRDDMEAIYENALDKGKYIYMVNRLKNEILGGVPYSQKITKPRHLFGSAFSPRGVIDHYETIIEPFNKVFYIKGSYIKGKSIIMERIMDEALYKGLFVEVYHEPMEAHNIETLVIPELKIVLTTSQKFEKQNYKRLDLQEFLIQKKLDENEDKIREDEILFERIISAGFASINKAKREHDVLETYYVPSMKFNKIDTLKKQLIEKILSFDKK
ncbi:MAG: ATPase [Thermotaleaceae bacterium]